MTLVLYISLGLLLLYLSFSTLFPFVLAVAGSRRPSRRPEATGGARRRFAVLIPAYREDSVIVNVATQALQQDYAAELFDVFVIADSLQPETLTALRRLPLGLIELSCAQSTKAKALKRALQQLPPQRYEAVVVLDADNLMAPDFLQQINKWLDRGFLAVQGQRTAQNLDTPVAIFDGAAEAANNYLLCRGPRQVGWSARLMGSGMAFDFDLFYRTMMTIDAIGGFDKELELKLTYEGVTIAYAEDALVYDEKVRDGNTLGRQRSRWLSAQYQYLARYGKTALVCLLQGRRTDFVHKVLLLALPPRVVLPLLLSFGLLVSWLVSGFSWLTLLWGILWLINLATFALTLPGWLFRAPYRRAWLHIGIALGQTLRALLLMRKARRQFIHTPHGPAKTI